MDFGAMGFDGLVSSDGTNTSSSGGGGGGLTIASLASSDPDQTKQQQQHKWLYGSGCFKQGRSATVTLESGGCGGDDDEWRSSKLPKTENQTMSACLLNKSGYNNSNITNTSSSTLFSNGEQVQQQQQLILSFSCPKQESLSGDQRASQNTNTLPCFPLTSSSAYNRNTGYNTNGSFNGVNMQMGVTEASIRGPFTQSQWMELEHQALIYKYLVSNVAVPSALLFPIRKALESARFSCFPPGLLRPGTLGWGSFHLGFSGNTDPEPGRCRRTDGKKWRCSRDAVPDQKYCERHMNRGRHRSRKPVEGQSGHSAATTTTTTTTTTVKPFPNAAASSASASVVGPYGSGASNSLALTQHLQQLNNISASTPLSKMFLSKENVTERTQGSSKQHGSYGDSSRSEFGLVSSEFFLNPSQHTSTLISDQETAATQHSLLQFMDDWPQSQSDHDRSGVSWPQLDKNMQSDRTQLSISIPMASTDFMSSTSSPNNEKVTLSSLKLSRELDPIQMRLGVGTFLNEQNQRQSNWIPISWESSMGGPLGEVLHNTNNNSSSNSSLECKNSSALNLMSSGTDVWESSSSRLGSSPTGVLQRTTFGSHSNSSAGSSPRAAEHYMNNNNKISEGANSLLCNDLLIGSTLVHSSASLPAL